MPNGHYYCRSAVTLTPHQITQQNSLQRAEKALKALWGLISRPNSRPRIFLYANVTTRYRKRGCKEIFELMMPEHCRAGEPFDKKKGLRFNHIVNKYILYCTKSSSKFKETYILILLLQLLWQLLWLGAPPVSKRKNYNMKFVPKKIFSRMFL